MILKQKDLKQLRANQECYLCHTTEDLVVDHQHIEQQKDYKNDGRVRHILCRGCNGRYAGIASIESSIRLLANKLQTTPERAAQQVFDYLFSDYSQNALHPNYVKDMCSIFNRKSAEEQKAILLELNVADCAANKAKRLAQYKAVIKQQNKSK